MTRERGLSTDQSDRAQTMVDFAIGVGLFLITVAFVIGTVPGMLEPFAQNQDEPLLADRIASQLAEDTLGNPSEPARLNKTCTVAFFEDTGAGSCSFAAGNPLTTQIGVAGRHSVNITLRKTVSGGGEPEILCLDGTDVQDCTAGGDGMARGKPVPESTNSVMTARRTVYIDESDTLLMVKVW